MLEYRYQPLDNAKRQIRLLDILPGSGLIKCNLRTQSLPTSTHGSYEALSYFWGTPSALKVITVDGFSFSITPNLHAALLRLRGSDSEGPRTMWIDAICIDQKNLLEKNTQIPLMRDIYSFCRRVVIWLGEHDVLTESALEGIEFMASRSRNGEQFNYYDWKKVRRGDRSQGLLRYVPLSGQVETLMSAATMTSFFSRPWFTRVWVVQELTLSPQAIVICGKFQIDWDRIVKADETSRTNFEHDLGTFKRFRTWPQNLSYDIFDRMMMAWQLNATDPRDKIYGLMGLEIMPPEENLIDVD
ncbi:HET-domain-containing protein [Viridothelium virens]|uniref:HET-domain-containing protein n=1 Tax=Viridothelium virens TaxID=1048519 RepID=A0A6A6H440_VIRVR|nr:HET-domain-containing protein [Viridothelium virens]